jgi:glycosyltransferase involved in cell wall biosynthesis
MKIIINTAHQRFGGAVQVALSFISECKNFPEHEYHVWVGQGVGQALDKSIFPSNFYFYDFDFGVIGFKKINEIQETLRPLEEKIQPDVLLSSTGPTYYKSIAPQIIGFNLPLYIYPESPYVKNLSLKSKLKLILKKRLHYYYFKRDATAYVAQTEDVNKRVRRALKTDKVHTVTNNHSGFYLDHNLQFENKLPLKEKGEFRFLTLTSYYEHKNLDLIVKISELLHTKGLKNIKFVLTLKKEDQLKYNIEGDGIINVGPLKPQECRSLYKECDAMFLPTLAECFSASYPEAMIMEKPIITTNLGFATSICGNAALYFKPLSAEDACEKIISLIQNENLRLELIEEGKKELKKFDTPKERARKYLEICAHYKNVKK